MKLKPGVLILALALGLSPLLPGVASADGGHSRGYDSHHHSHGRHNLDYDRWDYHRHTKKRHKKHYDAPRVVYCDRPRPWQVAKDSPTIVFNGRLR